MDVSIITLNPITVEEGTTTHGDVKNAINAAFVEANTNFTAIKSAFASIDGQTTVPSVSSAITYADITKSGESITFIFTKDNNPENTFNIVIPSATSSQAGLMSALDKAKLDGLSSGLAALPKNVVIEGSTVITAGSSFHLRLKLNEQGRTDDISFPMATNTSSGLMNSQDKAKLNAIPDNYVLISSTFSITERNANGLNIAYTYITRTSNSETDAVLHLDSATIDYAGLMSSTDKRNLDSYVAAKVAAASLLQQDTLSSNSIEGSLEKKVEKLENILKTLLS